MSIKAKKFTAVITGATGFVGHHLVSRLDKDGWKTHVIVRPDSDQDRIQSLPSRTGIHIHDGTTEHLTHLFSEFNADIVFHAASYFTPEHKPEEVEPLIRSNVLFGTQLLEAMVSNGVFHLINFGTSWQHYLNEEYNPVCLYAASKQAFETIFKYYSEICGLKVITLKLFDTSGPNDPRKKLFYLLKNAAETGDVLKMSKGEQLIDMVYIDDVIEACHVAAERLQSGKTPGIECFAVSSGNPVSLRELVDLYQSVTGSILHVDWGSRPYRVREVMVPWNSGNPVPGWYPKVSILEQITRQAK